MQLAVPSRLLPRDAGPEAGRLVLARGLRGFADGMVSVLLAAYLTDLGFSAGQVGVLITATLIGSAALTLTVGILGQSLNPRSILLCTSGLMLATGIAFASVTEYWPLVLIAIAGTLNPSNGDVSLFLPTEQAVLSGAASGQVRTALFARYNLAGIFCGALGALSAGVPVAIAKSQGWDLLDAQRSGFVVYALVAVLVAVIYRGLPKPPPRPRLRTAPLAKSRGVVLRLTALFSIDSFAGGFVVQSLLVLWLFKRFDLSVETAGAIFFVAGLLSACSQLASAWLSARIGLIRTMVYTHLPSNACLIIAALMPSAPLAVAFLLLRTSMSQMDVPARQSYVMAVVPPEERAAAASVTNVPRALASSLSPAISGVLLATTSFGWPLIITGVLKIIYDLLLLAQFQSKRPEEELAVRPATT
ncbi:MAG TPA: MFS transporter [Dehalococcoidia bacterium]|jgi:predicted MFS family arabinose efflux permease